MVVDGAGNVYVTGTTKDLSTTSDYVTVKYNTEGVMQWVSRYNGPGNSDDTATAIAAAVQTNLDRFGVGIKRHFLLI